MGLEQQAGIFRRDFLKGAFAAGALAAAAGVSGCAASTGGAATNTGTGGQTTTGALTAESAKQQKWVFEIAPAAIPESEIVETIEADVVVVGAGVSGLVTANSAAEEGLKVAVVTASKAPVARGGSNNAITCKAMEREGYPPLDAWEVQRDIYVASGSVDQKKWYKNYANNETAINWACDLMEEKGYGITIEVGTPMDNPLFHQQTAAVGWVYGDNTPDPELPETIGMMQPLFARRLAERLTDELSGEIYFLNVAKQLVRGGIPNGTDGRVEAVIALREDGSYAKYVGTKAVILATGDFSANRDMMAKYCPAHAKFISDDVYDGETDYDIGFKYGGLYKGEGQQMGLWVGAAWQKGFPNCGMLWGSHPGPAYLYGCHYGLMVDRDGKRFMNEYALAPVGGQTIRMNPGALAYAIWDSEYARYEQVSGSWQNDSIVDDPDAMVAAAIADWDQKVDNGDFERADTLEELISKLGLPAAALDTIKQYNEFCASGKDLGFQKPAEHLHAIEKGPFYGQSNNGEASVLTVMGGLRTNDDMQVCDEDDNPIPGLYNVGTMTGDVFGGIYTFQIEGANYGMCCITFGYLTGKYIADNE